MFIIIYFFCLNALSEKQVHKEDVFNEINYSEITSELQVQGIVKFLSDLCQATEDHKIMHPWGILGLSYSVPKHNWSGRRTERF